MFHASKEAFSSKEVRQAVFYAVNTDKLIEEKMKGHAGKVSCVLAETNKDYHPASTIYNYDPEKAKQLIASTGKSTIQINFVLDKNC